MPDITIDSFYDQARHGKLIGLKCDSGHVTVPPRQSCRICDSRELQPVELSGRWEVVSFTEVHVKSKEFPIETPYALALVSLQEGGNLIGVLRGSAARYGLKVRVKFEDVSSAAGKWPRTFFEPV